MKTALPILLIIVGLAMVVFGGKNCWDAIFPVSPSVHVEADLDGLTGDIKWIVANATVVICGWMTLLGGVLVPLARQRQP